MEVQREQLALDQVRLDRLPQPDRDVGLAHREVEFFLGGEQRDPDVGIEVDEFAEPWRQPMDAEAGRRGHLELAVGTFPRIGQLGARRLELHEHFVRGVVQQLALLGEDQPARMTMEQRDPKLLLERRHLPRHRRLRQPEMFAGMRKASRLGSGVEDLQLIPVHLSSLPSPGQESPELREGTYSAATRDSDSPCAARNFSDSSAAMQPWPAAVTAWR